MAKEVITNKEIERYHPSLGGLTNQQVEERISDKLTNKTTIAVGKSVWEIIRTNVFSFFSILLFVIAGLMIFANYYTGLFFLGVLIPNIIIGLYEDFKARHLLTKLRLLTAPKAIVVRDGQRQTIQTEEIVLDDVMILTHDMQICADGVLLDGTLLVNESLLTGESTNIPKQKGDVVYSGSFVVSGEASVRADKIGKDTYLESLQRKANSFKRSPSEILRDLRKLFRVIGVVVIISCICMVALYATQGAFKSLQGTKDVVRPISGSMVAMIPSGLYLLTSLALATSVISLAKKNARVQDFYSVEMLARTNVLCVDKTGTITDGTMSVKQIIGFNNIPQDEIRQIVSNLLIATKDDNVTAKGLKKYFNFQQTVTFKEVLPFNSDNKYSAATFSGNHTYVLGAAEFLNLNNKAGLLKRMSEFTSLGYRVMVLGSTDGGIINNKVIGTINTIALIVLQDHIKENAISTFKWFKENGVAIKVISGDNAVTVSEIARQAGVENANKYISLEGMSLEEVEAVADEYTVFGRVTPEQKEAIVLALKKKDKTVAMTGDGVNDILALKRADCSIAMAAGSDAARNVSHIVLLDNNFNHLPDVVAEGRRVINNVQRTSTLFLTKTSFAVFFTFAFLIMGLIFSDKEIRYPFTTNNLYLWETLALGIPSFFVTLEPKKDQIRGSFLGNIMKKLVPGAIAIIAVPTIIYVLFYLQYFHVTTTGIYPDYNSEMVAMMSSEVARSMSAIGISIMGVVILFKTCHPFSKYRLVVCISAAVSVVLGLLAFALFSEATGKGNLLEINFKELTLLNYIQTLVITLGVIAVYLYVTYLISVLKGEDNTNETW